MTNIRVAIEQSIKQGIIRERTLISSRDTSILTSPCFCTPRFDTQPDLQTSQTLHILSKNVLRHIQIDVASNNSRTLMALTRVVSNPHMTEAAPLELQGLRDARVRRKTHQLTLSIF